MGMLNGDIYKNRLQTLKQLKDNIRQEIDAVSEMLVAAFHNIERCIEAYGGHF